ncbi:MAG: FecR family protein [Ginsengibacter sp.]
MPDFLSIEELIIDDSFHNYCFQKIETDILYWEQYLSNNPSQKEKIREAKEIVLGLHVMLEQKYAGNKITPDLGEQKNKSHLKVFSIKKIFRYAAAVAAIFIVILISSKMFNVTNGTSNESNEQIASNTTPPEVFFKTANGERKMITLSDSTKIWLNVASELRVDKGFGTENRDVYLIGEALFEVVHNESLPFVVHTDKYNVKDLGTIFNVKVYPGDQHSETSLIKGKVEIQFPNSTRKISLLPNQKAVVNNNDESSAKENQPSVLPLNTQVILAPLSYDHKDSAVIEIAWVQNRLEIVNENFYEMKDQLERWFNVKISIKDEAVGKYPFTATFKKENIKEVLQALQYAYHFNYKIENNEVNISK